jgi:carboxyl-terminal processing protease
MVGRQCTVAHFVDAMTDTFASICRWASLLGLLVAAVDSPAQDAAAARAPPIPLASIQEFTTVLERTRADSLTPIEGDALLVAAMKGMLQRIDPEGGDYWTKSEFEDFKTGGDRSEVGVGVEIRVRQGQLAIFPVDGGPAAPAGIHRGDWVRTIDGVAVAGLRPQEAAKLLRGAAGSKVVLGIARGESGTVLELPVERRSVATPPVAVSRVDADLAVLRVSAFQRHTLQQVADALSQEWTRRPFKGLVIDLRHNYGGLLESSIGLAAAFLKPDELVVRTVGRIREANQEYHATPADYARRGEGDPLAQLPPALRALPLVVLVDESTASAAEIAAAALRDHGRAVVVGHATYGRGSVQTVMPLPSGAAMKVTTAYYISPSGQQFQGKGLQPDVPVASDDEAQALQAALAALRKRL